MTIILLFKFVETDLLPAVVFLTVLCLSTAAGMLSIFATFAKYKICSSK